MILSLFCGALYNYEKNVDLAGIRGDVECAFESQLQGLGLLMVCSYPYLCFFLDSACVIV